MRPNTDDAAAKGLEEGERRFRAVFDQSAGALFVHDAAGRIVDCNAEACRSLGYSREELLSRSVKAFATNLTLEEEGGAGKGGSLWKRAVADKPGLLAGAHFGEHRRKDGTTFPVEVRVSGVDYGGSRMILASVRDVTEREETERRLREVFFADVPPRLVALREATEAGDARSVEGVAHTLKGSCANWEP